MEVTKQSQELDEDLVGGEGRSNMKARDPLVLQSQKQQRAYLEL